MFPGVFRRAEVGSKLAPQQFPLWGWPLRNGYNSLVALTNAERQRRFRERRAGGEPVLQHPPRPRPPRPKPRPARWAAAVAELRTLQAEYETWRDNLPEALAGSRTAELLDEVCDVDLGTAGPRPR